MSTVVDAIFDGNVFRPNGKVSLKPNTRVQITVEVEDEKERHQSEESFLAVARSLKLQGPSDFSERLDDYLYSGKDLDAE